MSRPPFMLTDEQAKRIAQACGTLLDRIPVSAYSHRPFVSAFIEVVYAATGRTFGPGIYRRLLGAYAPGRNPSTDTLVREKALFEERLGRTSHEAASQQHSAEPPVSGLALDQAIEDGVKRALREFKPALEKVLANADGAQHDAYLNYFRTRMHDLETAMATAQAESARLGTALQEALAANTIYKEQLGLAQEAVLAHAQAAERAAAEQSELRKFTLMSIDAARGETRDSMVTCRQLGADLAARERELDALRNRAFSDVVGQTFVGKENGA